MATFGFHTDCDCCDHTTVQYSQTKTPIAEMRNRLEQLRKEELNFRPHVALDLGTDPYVLLYLSGIFFKVPYYESLQRGTSGPVIKASYRFRSEFICDHTGKVWKSYPQVSDKVQDLYNRIGKTKFEKMVIDLTSTEPALRDEIIREQRNTIATYNFLKEQLGLHK